MKTKEVWVGEKKGLLRKEVTDNLSIIKPRFSPVATPNFSSSQTHISTRTFSALDFQVHT